LKINKNTKNPLAGGRADSLIYRLMNKTRFLTQKTPQFSEYFFTQK